MKRILFALAIYIYAVASSAQILIDESGDSSTLGGGSSSSSFFGSSVKADLESFTGGEALRAKKKMAISSTIAGATGLLGLGMNLNFAPDYTFSLGFGVSRGFQSFNLHVKHTLGGDSLMPYVVGGYSRWSSNSEGEVESTSPGILKEKFLSNRELKSGDFSENILYPGFGLEYVNLTGDWQGIGFFAEVLLLIDIDDLESGITGGVGSIYYF